MKVEDIEKTWRTLLPALSKDLAEHFDSYVAQLVELCRIPSRCGILTSAMVMIGAAGGAGLSDGNRK